MRDLKSLLIALDNLLEAEIRFDGELSEVESLEILRIFNQSLRRRTTYGEAKDGTITNIESATKVGDDSNSGSHINEDGDRLPRYSPFGTRSYGP